MMLSIDAPLPTLTIHLLTLRQLLPSTTEGTPASGAELARDYQIQLQYHDTRYPEDQGIITQLVTIPYGTLGKALWDPDLYGSMLSNSLFSQPAVRQYFIDSYRSAFRTAKGMRLVLRLDHNDPKLLGLRWETLRHPETNKFLFTDSNLPFSRYLEKREVTDWKTYDLVEREDLTAIVAVASPKIEKNGLQLGDGPRLMPIDKEGEILRAQESLKPIKQITKLAGRPGSQKQATQANLEAELSNGCDIFYLACHGAMLEVERGQHRVPFILLEKENGEYHRLDARKLVDFLAELEAPRRPRLVVLASCQSAGDGSMGESDAHIALGPLLAQAGIPAVIAMQNNIKMETIKKFMPVFFKELSKDGHIEQAMALARSIARDAKCDDWWSPVLFTRLRDGKFLPNATGSGKLLENYLSIASQKPQFSRSVNRNLEELWRQPYKGHLQDKPAAAPQELKKVVCDLFSAISQEQYKRAVLLGSNGQGKTTAIKWLRADLARDALKQIDDPRQPVPVYFSLNDLNLNNSLQELALESINQLLGQIDQPEAKVRAKMKDLESWAGENRLLFMIDDLEALITRRFGVGLEALSSFMGDKRFNKNQYLISCRSSSYQGQLGAVPQILLDDLDDEQVKDVLKKDYKDINPQMRKCARNRSVLRLIVEVKGKKHPTKGQFMKQWVEQSLELHGERVMEMDTTLIRTLLEQIAFEMARKHTHVFKEEELMVMFNTYLNTRRDLYNWREVLHCMRTIGALSPDPSRRLYAFSERSFADYFSAMAVINDPERRAYFLQTVSDYWWRDMLEILIGLEQKPEDLLFELIDRDVRVAASCVEYSGIKQTSLVYSALIDGLVEYMDRESSSRRKMMVERINESDHERVPEVLLRRLHREWSSIVIMAIVRGLEKNKRCFSREALVETEKKVIDSMAQDSVSYEPWLDVPLPEPDERPDHRTSSKKIISKAEYIQQMIAMLENAELSPKVRGMAAISLGLTHDPQAVPCLLDCMMDKHINGHIAWCAAEALTEFRDSSLPNQICQICSSLDYLEAARHKARFIYLLGWSTTALETGEENTLCGDTTPKKLLVGALDQKEAPIVRGYAIQALTRLGFRDTRVHIQKLMLEEDEPMVLRKAAEALGQLGTPDTIKLLESKMKEVRAQENLLVRSAYRNAIRDIQERYGL